MRSNLRSVLLITSSTWQSSNPRNGEFVLGIRVTGLLTTVQNRRAIGIVHGRKPSALLAGNFIGFGQPTGLPTRVREFSKLDEYLKKVLA